MRSVDDEGVEYEDEADLIPTDETDIGTPKNKAFRKCKVLV